MMLVFAKLYCHLLETVIYAQKHKEEFNFNAKHKRKCK